MEGKDRNPQWPRDATGILNGAPNCGGHVLLASHLIADQSVVQRALGIDALQQ
jgi:hypothetical protein